MLQFLREICPRSGGPRAGTRVSRGSRARPPRRGWPACVLADRRRPGHSRHGRRAPGSRARPRSLGSARRGRAASVGRARGRLGRPLVHLRKHGPAPDRAQSELRRAADRFLRRGRQSGLLHPRARSPRVRPRAARGLRPPLPRGRQSRARGPPPRRLDRGHPRELSRTVRLRREPLPSTARRPTPSSASVSSSTGRAWSAT